MPPMKSVHRSRAAGALIFGLSLSTVCVVATLAQQIGDAPQELVIADIQARLAFQSRGHVTPADLSLRQVDTSVSAIRVVEIRYNASHWNTYLVGVTETGFLRLGGFADPDVRQLAAALGRHRRWGVETPMSERGALLALLLTPWGIDQACLPQLAVRPCAPALERSWAAHRPPGWPRDSIRPLPGGASAVGVTVLAPRIGGWGGGGEAAYSVFVFSADGEVQGWTREAQRLGFPIH